MQSVDRWFNKIGSCRRQAADIEDYYRDISRLSQQQNQQRAESGQFVGSRSHLTDRQCSQTSSILTKHWKLSRTAVSAAMTVVQGIERVRK